MIQVATIFTNESVKFKGSVYASQPTFTCSKSTMESTRAICEIWSKLTIKTLERRRRHSIVFIANFEQIQTLFWCFYCWLETSKYRLGFFGILALFNHVFLAYLETIFILCYTFSERLKFLFFKINKTPLKNGESQFKAFELSYSSPILNSFWNNFFQKMSYIIFSQDFVSLMRNDQKCWFRVFFFFTVPGYDLS